MAYNLRVTNGFEGMADPYLLTRAQEIYAAMSGNPHFPTPTPSLATLQAKITEYSNALTAAASGGEVEKRIKDDKKAELIDILHTLANYVVLTANQNRTVAASSGFTLAKEPEPATAMGNPATPTLSNGDGSGEVKAATESLTGAKAYMFQYAEDPLTDASVWTPQLASRSQTVLRNLTVGKRYWVKVTAVGSKDQIKSSDAMLSKLVQ